MKSILLVLCMCFTLSSFAQVEEKTELKYLYCQILGTQKLLSSKVTVKIDFGQVQKFFGDQRLRDEKGEVIDFNSMVDAMNWMGNRGWEFQQAYVVTVGQQNVYHWLLKMTLDDLSPEKKKALLEMLKTKADFKKKK